MVVNTIRVSVKVNNHQVGKRKPWQINPSSVDVYGKLLGLMNHHFIKEKITNKGFEYQSCCNSSIKMKGL